MARCISSFSASVPARVAVLRRLPDLAVDPQFVFEFLNAFEIVVVQQGDLGGQILQTADEPSDGPADGERRGGQQFAEDQRDQGPLTGGQGDEDVSLEKGRHFFIKPCSSSLGKKS